MTMKSRLGAIYGVMAAAAAATSNIYDLPKDKTENRLAEGQDLGNGGDSQRIRQGQKKFYFGENFVWARNESNAKRKAKNKNWI